MKLGESIWEIYVKSKEDAEAFFEILLDVLDEVSPDLTPSQIQQIIELLERKDEPI